MASQYGFTDEAAEKDLFGITDYIGGLANFLEKCNTPLTISIQGSWGTGKTSIMNLVKNELSDRTIPIWFNTWQFSQFNMDNQLAVSLLSSLIREFKIHDEATVKKSNKLINSLRVIGGLGKDIGLAYIDSKIGGKMAELVEKVVNDGIDYENVSNSLIDPTTVLSGLRDQFAECVKKSLNEQNKERIVIFIDDLDRLEPRKAVELLEVLKIFLDCKNCVFVLAIDYDVVCRGVVAKYGTLANEKEAAEEKGKSFFDKIIQVPFKMPTARYDISKYVSNCFEQIGIQFAKNEDIITYVDLIKRSIGTNPRSMKRLFNSYQLLMIVVPDSLLSASKNRQLLFAILCLQYCSEKIYNFMIQQSGYLTVDIVNAFVESDFEKFSTLVENMNEITDITDDDLSMAQPFMDKFATIIDSDGKNGIDNSELQNFVNVLEFSAITSANDNISDKKRCVATIVNRTDDIIFKKNLDSKEYLDQMLYAFSEVLGPNDSPILKNRDSSMTVGFNMHYDPFFEVNIFERKNGFSVEFSGDTDLFSHLPEKVTDFINRNGRHINTFSKGLYFQITVRNGDSKMLSDVAAVISEIIAVVTPK